MDNQTALKELQDQFSRLRAAAAGLDERAMSTVFFGSWNVKDILAHIAGWQRTMTESMQRMARGERPTPEGVDYSDADAWNAGFAAAMRPQDSTTVVAYLEQTFANYVRAAKALPEDRFGEGKTINKLLEASGYGHYRQHVPAVEAFKAKQSK